MREIRLKAAKHIHAQKKKDGTLPAEEVFKESDCDMADIVDGDVYYVGFTFRSALASHIANKGLMTAFADASHMDGKGSSTYGTFYDVGTYDPNRALLSIACGHSIGPECKEEWATRFDAAANVPGFDVPGRVTLVDMEKSIGAAFNDAMDHAKKFNDERHVIKNMNNKLGPSEKATGPALYSRALRAPSVLEVEQLKASYGPAQKSYLGKFPDRELYRACSPGLEDTIVTSQGAESSMNAALANKIRRVEPMALLKLIAENQQRKFNAQKVQCTARLPPVSAARCFLFLLRLTSACHRRTVNRPWPKHGPGRFHRLSSRHLRS